MGKRDYGASYASPRPPPRGRHELAGFGNGDEASLENHGRCRVPLGGGRVVHGGRACCPRYRVADAVGRLLQRRKRHWFQVPVTVFEQVRKGQSRPYRGKGFCLDGGVPVCTD